MTPRIELMFEKKLLGKSIKMSLSNDKTTDVWKSFMTDRKAISNAIGPDLYSIQEYDNLNYFKNFNPHNEFLKWATIEVTDFNNIPTGFNTIVLSGGLYAVFIHKGDSSKFSNTIQFIFTQWLPKSTYVLDHRPHFEVLGAKYKNNNPSSEEEIWIPIRPKE